MPQFSDPNQSNPSASSNIEERAFEVVLEAGLDAIDKKNYPEAIAKLETVHQNAKRRSLQLRAQMGLVKAYEGHGEYQQAFIRCKELLKSSSEPTRQWAEEAMTVLKQRYKQLPKSLNHLQNAPKSPIPDLEANRFKTDSVKDDDRRSPFRTDASTILDTQSADIFEETQPNRTERSPFLTEASTLVDPLAMETSTLSEPAEASTLLDPFALDRSESPASVSDVEFFEEEVEEDFFEEERGGEELVEESLPEEDVFEDPLFEELSEETQSQKYSPQEYSPQEYSPQDYPLQEERVDNLETSSEPSDPTGFVPIDTGADLSMADSGMADSGMDSTGFVPLDSHPTSEP
ncbi:MAG: hypothetical protein VKL39_06360, partial [Leptolyngbyaceae bacterium]|nr:hypothetical protein [Leptolyngbyaceae bacterium]